MKEHPILFSTSMVQAILEGRKTQTRRVVKPQPYLMDKFYFKDFRKDFGGRVCPYGQVGDRLWVRETWGYICSVSSYHGTNPEEHYAHIRYIADGGNRNIHFATAGNMKAALPKQNLKRPDNFATLDESQKEWTMSDLCTNWWKKQKVKPSIFMPRWASRITLEITDIKVQRLWDISDSDVAKEGCTWNELGTIEGISFPKSDTKSPAQRAYKSLWDKINGKNHAWESNCWVWCIEFKRIV